MTEETKKIGSVKLSIFAGAHSNGLSAYDKELHGLHKKGGKEADFAAWTQKNPRSFYDFSNRRKSLVDWYDFASDSRLLEVGSGNGSLTGFFAERCKSVTALDASVVCAETNAIRHKTKKNVHVVAGSLGDVSAEYDYVTLIDLGRTLALFEHDDSFNNNDTFFSVIASLLRDSGTLILAVDNSLGLKNWAGVADRQTGRYFDALEGYPTSGQRFSFTKQELMNYLVNASFTNIRFYYPVPDFVEAIELYSDAYVPNAKHGINPFTISPDTHGIDRVNVFNEHIALDTIVRADQFSEFANSFLVFARKES